MPVFESFRDKSFIVDDPDTRIRQNGNPMAFEVDGGGHFRTIALGDKIRIGSVQVSESGSQSSIIFGQAISATDDRVIGWTSTRNLKGRFQNETIGLIEPAANASRFGPNAAWSGGQYRGQIDLVAIVDAKLQIKRLALPSVPAYLRLVAAAQDDGVSLLLNSGFRSYPEQKYFHDGFVRRLPGFNTAAKPGFSNHQNGIAFDIDVPGGDGNPTYEWLKRNAPALGFVRTVNHEPWHWEFDEQRARIAQQSGTFRIPTVAV